MNNELQKRYTPGRRENSFFVDMPVKKKKRRKRSSVTLKNTFEYTYYSDLDGNIIREKLK